MFLFLALALGATVGMAAANRNENRGFTPTEPPQSISLFRFANLKGSSLNLKNFRGRYVLLNLWSTSCAPCEAEMPTLNELSKKLDANLYAVIALNEDIDGIDAARLFYKRHQIDHLPVYNDAGGRAPFALHIRGLPTTVLINPDGLEIARLEGPADWTKDDMVTFLESRARR